jgi:protein-S-isoprenylcysteine O-methyltransferase Ste14
MTRASSRLPELGPRGEGWFAVQLALMGAVIGTAFTGIYWPGGVSDILSVLGFVAIAAGLVLIAAAALSLGALVSVFPRPRAGGKLVQSGIYRVVRHPVYGALILIALGWSLAESPLGLIPTALLAVFFDLKARVEEAWLEERFTDYASYRERTPSRFLPGLY